MWPRPQALKLAIDSLISLARALISFLSSFSAASLIKAIAAGLMSIKSNCFKGAERSLFLTILNLTNRLKLLAIAFILAVYLMRVLSRFAFAKFSDTSLSFRE